MEMRCADCGCVVESGIRVRVCGVDCCCRDLPVNERVSERTRHWDTAYEVHGSKDLSWFQSTPTLSLELIRPLKLPMHSAVIDVGGGASSLVDELVEQGFRNILVLDISRNALSETRRRLDDNESVTYLERDILTWRPERHFDLWHDRAVFHFFVDESDIQAYITTLKSAVRPGGIVVLATFAPDGPEYCSGLPVTRYSAQDLASVLGREFRVTDERNERHVTPSGATQPFTWVVAQRTLLLDGNEHA